MGEGDVPTGLRLVLPVFVGLGVVGGDRLGDEPVDDRRGRRSRGRRAVRRPRSRRPWTAGGSGGRPGGPARPAPPTEPTRFHSMGRRWRRSRASAISCAPADGGHAQRQRERFGGERRHHGVPVPAERLIGQQGRTAERLDPGVGWWRGGGRPSGRRAGACGTRLVVRPVRLSAAASSTPAGSRSPTSYSSRTVVLMGSSQASTTDSRGRESPVSTGVSAHRDLLVIWRTVEHPRSVRNPTDRTTRDRAGWSYSTGGRSRVGCRSRRGSRPAPTPSERCGS